MAIKKVLKKHLILALSIIFIAFWLYIVSQKKKAESKYVCVFLLGFFFANFVRQVDKGT
jgi:cbb3-type cytochrome oxidase subunit 3